MKHLSPSLSPLPFAEDSVQNLLSNKANPSCGTAGLGRGNFCLIGPSLGIWVRPGTSTQNPPILVPQQRGSSRVTAQGKPVPVAGRECPAACLACLRLSPTTSAAPAEILESGVPIGVLAGGRIRSSLLLGILPSLSERVMCSRATAPP